MTNINNLHSREDYIVAWKGETFGEYVARQESNALLRRRVLRVLLVSALIVVFASVMLHLN